MGSEMCIRDRNWDKTQRFSGIGILNSDGQRGVVIPTDILQLRNDAVENSFEVQLIAAGGRRIPLDINKASTESPVVTLALESESEDLIGTDSVSPSSAPAQAIVVRKSAESQTYLHLPIAESDIGLVQEGDVELWRLNNFWGDRAVWHGCPVLMASDLSLIHI